MPNVIIVNTLGPQGQTGPQGIQGPSGSLSINSSGSFGITGSLFISGSAPLVVTGPTVLSGSLNVTQGITGSLLGTATNALTASYTTNISGGSAGYVPLWKTDSTLGTSSIHQDDGNVGIGILLPEAKLHVKGPGSTDLYTSLLIQNSNGNPSFVVLGSGHVGIENLFPSYELDVTGTGRFTNGLLVTGSLRAPSITGSVEGTASNAVSSSYALTASYAANVPVTASYALSASVAVSSSYALNTTTASFATTASYIALAQTASYVLNAVSSSFSSTASYVLNAVSSSYAANASTASYVLNAVSSSFASTASFIALAQTASYVLNAVSSSYALSASYLIGQSPTSSYALTASYINPLSQNVSITGNLTVNGTASISYLNVAYESASIIYSSGSNQFGDAANDTQTLYGTVVIPTGSLTVTGSTTITGTQVASSGVGRTMLITSSISASANNNVLVGLDINPTFTNGAFTGVTNYAIRTIGDVRFELAGYPLYGLNITNALTGETYITKTGASNLIIEGARGVNISPTNNVGIGIATSNLAQTKLSVFTSAGTSPPSLGSWGGTFSVIVGGSNGQFGLLAGVVNNTGDAWFQAQRVDATATAYNILLQPTGGNVLIGTSTNAGFKLDVNGTGRFSGNLTVSGAATNSLLVKGSGTTSSTTALLVQNSNASSSLAVLDDGTVGVGTTSPNAKLTVKTSITNGSGTPGLRVYGTTNYIGMEYDEGQGPTLNTSYSGTGGGSPGSYNFYSGSTVLATIGTGGVFAHNLNGTFSHYSGNGYLETWNGSSGDTSLVNVGNYNMRFLTNNTERVRITGGGNVGIGTTSPAYTLDVSGSIRATGTSILSGAVAINSTNVSTGYALYVNGSAGINALALTENLTVGENYAIRNNGSQTIDIDSNNDTTNAVFRITANGTVNELFRINEEGLTGIGTASPTAKLQVKGSGATSSTTALLVENSNASASLAVLDNGNVGVGTASPSSKLYVQDTGGSGVTHYLSFQNDGNAYGGIKIGSSGQDLAIQQSSGYGYLSAAGFYIGSGNSAIWTNNGSILDIQNAAGSTTYLRIASTTGNVGIGTTSPAYKLDVSGSGNFTNGLTVTGSLTGTGGITGSLFGTSSWSVNALTASYALNAGDSVWTGSAGNIYYNGGNVGIGISTPSSKLHVVGNTILSGSAGTGSALYAYKSGSTVVDIQGSQGQLFSIVDALSGSLMSVNDISGLPILEVFSDDRVVMGTYGAPALTITGSNAVFTGSVIIDGAFLDTVRTGSLGVGSTLLYTINTGSYTAGFFDYFVNSGSNYRAGNIMAVFGAGTYKFTDLATPDIGSTTNLQFSMSMAGASAQLYASASSAGWTVKTTFRTI